MKNYLRPVRFTAYLGLLFAAAAFAQTEPIIGVDITNISVFSDSGSVLGINLTNPGSGYLTTPTVLISGGGGSGATAVATMSGGVVTGITVVDGGTGYTTLPTVTIAAPGVQATVNSVAPTTSPGPLPTGDLGILSGGSGYSSAPLVTITPVDGQGSGAAASATINTAGQVIRVTITSAGNGYTSAPIITVASPGTPATAVATYLGTSFSTPFQNESYGPYGVGINITAWAHGTYPASGYSYQFFVNGASLGQPAVNPVPLGSPAIIGWAPPQPGAYLLTVKASDGAHTATSLAVRYFATGTAIIGPTDNSMVPIGSSVVIQATAVPPPVGANAFVRQVDFYIDGQFASTDYTYPYSLIYTPAATSPYGTSTHTLEARAYDNNGNQISPNGTAVRTLRMVPPTGTPPTVRLLNPLDGTSISSGSTLKLIADATSPNGFIRNVDFYVNGVALTSSQTFPFSSSWTSQVPGKYQFVAIAFDDKSNQVASDPVTVTVTGGFPSIAITSPGSTGTSVIQGVKVPVAVTAAGADGGIASLSTIDLLVDGAVTASLPDNPNHTVPPPPLTEPFEFTWKSNVAVGTHRISARVTDVNGLTITSAEVPITVVANQLPSVSITNPEDGASGSVSNSMTIVANASDPDGAVDSVEFFVNGTSLGDPVTKTPYQWVWTPTAVGSYALTAKVTDNSGATVTSTPVTVTISPASSGGTGSNSVYRGDYGSATESGHFAFGLNRSGRGTFVAFSTNPTSRIYYWTDFAVNADGSFKVVDTSGNTVLSGATSATGVSGTFGDKMFIGPISIGSSNSLILSGTFTGDTTSTVTALVGADGAITIYSASGTKRDAGSGLVGSTNTYTIQTPNGSTVTGVVTASASVVSGNETGTISGTFLLRPAPSRLINLSTIATAGSADKMLVAGFTVNGGTKPLLIRAVGPSLASFGVSSPLPNPTLSVVAAGNASMGTNDDWAPSLAAVADKVGAFPLLSGSHDAALQISLPSAVYSAVVGGASSPGTAMVEIYDTESVTSGTGRLMNLSSRAVLAPGDTMAAGFVIAGDQRKKLLIRAVGPTLGSLGVPNYLEDPKLDVLLGSTVLASNDNWSGTQVSSAATTLKTFPLNAGSKDAAVVIQLSAGLYSVRVTGMTSSTGIVLLEIYDLD